jgi:hypothetical protein
MNKWGLLQTENQDVSKQEELILRINKICKQLIEF